MRVTFTKAGDRKDFRVWVATVGRRRIEGAGLGSDPRHLPHDIVTLVIERELGITDGFFGTVAAGGTFRSMLKRRSTAGRAVIARNRAGLTVAEHTVNDVSRKWRAGTDTTCNEALDRTYAAWMALPPGGRLTLEWLPSAAHPAKTRVRHRR